MAVLTKITSRSLADNAVTSAHVQGDVIAAGDIAAGAVGSSELADNAVTNASLNLDYSDATYRAPTIDNSFAAATKTIKKVDATTWYTVNDILVHLNGVCLIPTTDYTVTSSGTATLTLVEGAPATATSLVVRYLAR
jgi:hypothetical protein